MSLDIFHLDNRVAIVTGSSKGLGKAMAKALAGAGANVVVVSRHLNEAQNAADDITEETGKKTLALQVDVSQKSQVEEMVANTVAEFGYVTDTRSGSALRSALCVDGTRRRAASTGLGEVTGAGRGSAFGAARYEAVGGTRCRCTVAGFRHVAVARRSAALGAAT